MKPTRIPKNSTASAVRRKISRIAAYIVGEKRYSILELLPKYPSRFKRSEEKSDRFRVLDGAPELYCFEEDRLRLIILFHEKVAIGQVNKPLNLTYRLDVFDLCIKARPY